MIKKILQKAIELKASDVHISPGLPPKIRINGDIQNLTKATLNNDDINAIIEDITNPLQRKFFSSNLELDFSFTLDDEARFRVNLYSTSLGAAIAFRIIPQEMVTLSGLRTPEIFKRLVFAPRGLVLVTGPTGSGKSTTLAAMINHLNENLYQHILTIEDPIEYVHTSNKCMINQRELHHDTLSFANALKSALREDPDIIMVGEMRDPATIRLALTAAETGHLVLSTLHTTGAAKSIDRIIDVFPGDEQDLIRTMLSESLVAIISQILVKTADNKGRVAAHEIMLANSAIKNLIRENKIAQMQSTIQTSTALGMQSLDQSLKNLVEARLISPETARSKAVNPKDFI